MIEDEFLPLPYFPYDRRPSTIPIDAEEAATALYLAEGEIAVAAATLKVEPLRLMRTVRGVSAANAATPGAGQPAE